MTRRTHVIVGANLAGGRAALALRDEGFDGDVVLIGAEVHPPYERPPLSKDVLKGARSPESTYLQPVAAWADHDVDLRLGIPVTRIEPRWSGVELADGSRVRADRVLLSTGGRPRKLDVPGRDLRGVHYLRDIEDAVAIADVLQRGGPVVVIGAGFIGAEVTACARELGCEVVLLEVAAVPLERVLGTEMGALYADVHRARGVDVRTGTSIVAIEGRHGRVERVITSDGAVLPAGAVVIGVGMEPVVELAANAGITVDNGIVVDDLCRTSVPNVFAAGDVARHPNRLIGGEVRLEHWQNAQNQALAAAKSMVDRGQPYAEVPWFWSDQYDLNLQMAGHPNASDCLVTRGSREELSFVTFYVRDGRLSGAVAINRPRDVRGAIKLIESGALVELDALADETADLRKLAAAYASTNTSPSSTLTG